MKFIILTFILCSTAASAKENVIYKYKQYEKFDLGDMEIKGSIIAPGDLSIKERRRKIFKRKLFQRKDFDKQIITDIKYIR
jgi:hypothetical protein